MPFAEEGKKVSMQRTYSDPDLPQLLPLPARPSSSYEPRPKVKEAAQFTDDVMQAMAEKLGVNVMTQPEFNWVIRDCLLSLRDEGWTCQVRNGDLEYCYKYKDETRPYHPISEAHRKLAERLMASQKELQMAHLDPHYRVRHHVYRAIMGEKDVRRVSNPKLIEEILKDLDVSPSDEPYLIRRIKTSVEDAYFRYKRTGKFQTTIENCIDVESLVVNLELDRVGFMKKISPSGLLYCVECQTALGDVISAGCHDVLCNQCAVETHSTGNRQDAPLVFIEQAVCAECTTKAALVRCQDCVELFCYDCFKLTHAAGKRKRHCVGLPQRTFCFECDMREALGHSDVRGAEKILHALATLLASRDASYIAQIRQRAASGNLQVKGCKIDEGVVCEALSSLDKTPPGNAGLRWTPTASPASLASKVLSECEEAEPFSERVRVVGNTKLAVLVKPDVTSTATGEYLPPEQWAETIGRVVNRKDGRVYVRLRAFTGWVSSRSRKEYAKVVLEAEKSSLEPPNVQVIARSRAARLLPQMTQEGKVTGSGEARRFRTTLVAQILPHPDYTGAVVGGKLNAKEEFLADGAFLRPVDGRAYLHLKDGRGWICERAKMDFSKLAVTPCGAADDLIDDEMEESGIQQPVRTRAGVKKVFVVEREVEPRVGKDAAQPGAENAVPDLPMIFRSDQEIWPEDLGPPRPIAKLLRAKLRRLYVSHGARATECEEDLKEVSARASSYGRACPAQKELLQYAEALRKESQKAKKEWSAAVKELLKENPAGEAAKETTPVAKIAGRRDAGASPGRALVLRLPSGRGRPTERASPHFSGRSLRGLEAHATGQRGEQEEEAGRGGNSSSCEEGSGKGGSKVAGIRSGGSTSGFKYSAARLEVGQLCCERRCLFASYICTECEDALCSRCSAQIHRVGARQNHSLFGLRKAAYSKRLFADNLDRLMGILQRNIERAYDLSPWFIFYDQALAPSWYNFTSYQMVRADPNNLVNPPIEEQEGIPKKADDQVLRGLPGATILKDTHVAQLTAQGACFDVPPPVHVKFAATAR
ncbi:unnamed protein product [Effrenium voratum]|uniref:B box-type domain-containing protein n=1 Tax=Effrenium voratum TaxID=2562239 RepID=A0AA36MR75_9DINO|nr:unnamed protein product [Effrenium voratum]